MTPFLPGIPTNELFFLPIFPFHPCAFLTKVLFPERERELQCCICSLQGIDCKSPSSMKVIWTPHFTQWWKSWCSLRTCQHGTRWAKQAWTLSKHVSYQGSDSSPCVYTTHSWMVICSPLWYEQLLVLETEQLIFKRKIRDRPVDKQWCLYSNNSKVGTALVRNINPNI